MANAMGSKGQPLIILYGAFDRYNYGDNLMPILFSRFVSQYYPEIRTTHRIVYASVSASDLSQYGCVVTERITDLLDAPSGSSVVVVGGEVLCAKRADLFAHVQKTSVMYLVVKGLKKLSPKLLDWIARREYSAPWEYPYIPDRSRFKNDVSIALNAVGGRLPKGALTSERRVVAQRLEECVYFTVRDFRFAESAKEIAAQVCPDSAMAMSALYSKSEVDRAFGKVQIPFLVNGYLVVQAAPQKLKLNPSLLARSLSVICERLRLGVVLLAIGQTSGHDDFKVARQLRKRLTVPSTLISGQGVDETMALIAKSYAYLGTSLHGAITALSFGVPHFALGASVVKLTSYLEVWSVGAFKMPIDLDNIEEVFARDWSEDVLALKHVSRQGVHRALIGNHSLIKTLRVERQ